MTERDGIHPEEMISAMLDGEISAADAERVQQHLSACAECRLLVEDLRKIGAASKREAVPTLPDDLAARIRRRLTAPSGAASHRAPGFFRSGRYPLATAATLLVAVLIWVTLSRSRVTPVPPAESPEIAAQSAATDESATRNQALAPPEDLKARKSEPEKTAVAPGGRPEDRNAKEIESYSDLGKNAPPPAVGERRDEERKELDQAAPRVSSLSAGTSAAAPAGPPPPPATSSVVDKQSAKDAKKRENRFLGAAGETAESAAPARPRASLGPHTFLYETEAYSATFTEDGLVTLVARGYACSVNVPVPPATSSPSTSGDEGGTDLPALFRLATSAEFLAAEDGGASAPPAGEPATMTLHDAVGDTVHSVAFHPSARESAPPVLRKLDQAVQTLLRQTYRARLESRCGPIPPRALPTP